MTIKRTTAQYFRCDIHRTARVLTMIITTACTFSFYSQYVAVSLIASRRDDRVSYLLQSHTSTLPVPAPQDH